MVTVDLMRSELRRAMRLEGCPVCRLRLAGERDYFLSILRERATDSDLHGQVRRSLGFCHQHAWRLVAMQEWRARGDGMETAVWFESVVDEAIQRLHSVEARIEVEAADADRSAWSAIRAWWRRFRGGAGITSPLDEVEPCPVCALDARHDAVHLRQLPEGLDDGALVADYLAGDGLCVPHLRQTLALPLREPIARLLVEHQLRRLEHLHGQLREYLRKHDYRFLSEPRGDEWSAWRRAVARFSGLESPDPSVDPLETPASERARANGRAPRVGEPMSGRREGPLAGQG